MTGPHIAFWSGLIDADHNLFQLINIEWHHSALALFFQWLTWLGNAAVLLAVTLPLIWLWERERFKHLALTLCLALLAGGVLVQALKYGVDRPRPAARYSATIKLAGDSPRHRRSFPSGHSNTVFVAAVILAALRLRVAIPVFLLAFLVGFSRVYVGAHYPLDVLVGAMTGIAVGWVAWRIQLRRTNRERTDHHADLQ